MCIRRRLKTIRCSGLHKQEYAAREEVVPQTRAGLLPSINLNGSTAYNRLEYPNGRFIDTDPASPTFGQLRGIDGQDYNTHGWQAQLVQPLLDVAAYYTYKSAQALKAQAQQDYAASEQNLIVRTVSVPTSTCCAARPFSTRRTPKKPP